MCAVVWCWILTEPEEETIIIQPGPSDRINTQYAQAEKVFRKWLPVAENVKKSMKERRYAALALNEGLLKVLIALDGINSHGDRKVRVQRKEVVHRVQQWMELVDDYKKSELGLNDD